MGLVMMVKSVELWLCLVRARANKNTKKRKIRFCGWDVGWLLWSVLLKDGGW